MVYRKRGNSQWTDIPLPEHTSQRRNEIPIGPSNYGPVLFFAASPPQQPKHEPTRRLVTVFAQTRTQNAGWQVSLK
jgi:hypothetical protein